MTNYLPSQPRCRLYDVPGAANVRDLGGYPGQDGAPITFGRFIRAGGMDALTDLGIRQIRGLGVDSVIDLRSRAEAAKQPDTLAQDSQIEYIHIPMLDSIQSSFAQGGVALFPASMVDMYIHLLEDDKKDFLRVFQVFADPGRTTTLFHCTAGKDRTGLTAMLLLGLAGVSREDIAEDYAYSNLFTTPRPENVDLPEYLFTAPPENILTAMTHLDENYGGIPAYLTHIGVTREMAEVITGKLLQSYR